MAMQHGSIIWERDSERGLSTARAQERNALLDFSAAPM